MYTRTPNEEARDYGQEMFNQIARLLNESDVFLCVFVAIKGRLYAMIDIESNDLTGAGYYYDEITHPGVWLQAVKGA